MLTNNKDITASSLHSYMAQGLNYNDSKISSTIEESIAFNSSDTFLSQGVRFQGLLIALSKQLMERLNNTFFF